MNPYSKMRDPFENQRPMFQSVGGFGGDAEAQERIFWAGAVQRAVGRARDRACLLSLTRGADERIDDAAHKPARAFRCPWARPRMWEQYAENHAGACLIFDRVGLLNVLEAELEPLGQYRAGEVRYTVGGFATSRAAHAQFDNFREASLDEDVAQHVSHHFEDFFLLKTDDWASECEYRVVFQSPENRAAVSDREMLVSFGTALRFVVVGERFPEWQLPGARRVADEAGVELRRMSWAMGHPWLGEVRDKGLRLGAQ